MPLTDPNDFNEEDDNIEDTDYIFVIDTAGHLKSVLLPDGFENNITPENVTKILEIFDVGTFHAGTLH